MSTGYLLCYHAVSYSSLRFSRWINEMRINFPPVPLMYRWVNANLMLNPWINQKFIILKEQNQGACHAHALNSQYWSYIPNLYAFRYTTFKLYVFCVPRNSVDRNRSRFKMTFEELKEKKTPNSNSFITIFFLFTIKIIIAWFHAHKFI